MLVRDQDFFYLTLRYCVASFPSLPHGPKRHLELQPLHPVARRRWPFPFRRLSGSVTQYFCLTGYYLLDGHTSQIGSWKMSSFSWVPSEKSQRLSVFLRKQEGVAPRKQLATFTTATQSLNWRPSLYFLVYSSTNSQLRGKLNQQVLTGRKTSCFSSFHFQIKVGALSSGRVCIMRLFNIMPLSLVPLVHVCSGSLQAQQCFGAFLGFVRHQGRG